MEYPPVSERWLSRVVRSSPSFRETEVDDLLQLARIEVWRNACCYPDLAPGAAAKFVRQAVAQHGQRAAARRARISEISLDALMTPVDEDVPSLELADPEAVDPCQMAQAKALRRWFSLRISELPPDDCDVVLLRYGWCDNRERTLPEVAFEAGMSVKSVRCALARAHRALREAVETEGWFVSDLLETLGGG